MSDEHKFSRVDWLMREMQSSKPSRTGRWFMWLGSIDIETFSTTFWIVVAIGTIGIGMGAFLTAIPLLQTTVVWLALILIVTCIYLVLNITISTHIDNRKRAKYLLKIAAYSGIPFENSYTTDSVPYFGPAEKIFPRAFIYNRGRTLAFNSPQLDPAVIGSFEEELRNPEVDYHKIFTNIVPYNDQKELGMRLVQINLVNVRPGSVKYAREFALEKISATTTPEQVLGEDEAVTIENEIRLSHQRNQHKSPKMKRRLDSDLHLALNMLAPKHHSSNELERALKKELQLNWHIEGLELIPKSNNWEIAEA